MQGMDPDIFTGPEKTLLKGMVERKGVILIQFLWKENEFVLEKIQQTK
jgi:hypothetical protein